MIFTSIFTLTLIIASICAFPSSSDVFKNTENCKLFKDKNFTCYPDDSEFRVDLKSPYVVLIVNTVDESIELKCNQRHVVNLTHLESFPSVNLSKMSKLSIAGCVIGDDSFFKVLGGRLSLRRSLTTLDIDIKIDKTKKIVPEVFNGLESATEMKLYTHSNHTFHPKSFMKFEDLTMLELHVYDLMEPPIPSTLFNGLRSLNSLSIFSSSSSRKQQQKLLDLSISDFINLEKFSLQGVRWPLDLHLKLPRILTQIEIKNNHKITKLDENCFKRNDQIERMDLSNNSIADLPPRVFWSQSQLEKIDLSFNKLRNLSQELFARNKFLEVLDLSNNELTTLGIKCFQNLESLRVLRLDNNYLTVLYLTINFYGTSELEVLTLRNNLITNINQEMPSFKLAEIDLSSNNLSHFYPSKFLPSSDNLKIILSSNVLESLDFKAINENAIGENQTVTIDVGDSLMKCNCETANFYAFLHKKSFKNAETYERFKVIPEDVKCIQASDNSVVKVANMDPDSLICSLDTKHRVVCPSSCRCLRRPDNKMLTITCINILEVPILPPYNLIESLDIIQLEISGNGIKSLPTTLKGAYHNVTEIYAAFNSISHVEASSLPPNLEIIDLRFNLLTTLDLEVIARFSAMRRVQLSENLWNCSRSRNLIEFVKRERNVVVDFNDVRCRGDGKFFLEFDFEASCSVYVYIALAIFTISLLFGASIYFYCKNRRAIAEWIFVNDKRHIVEHTRDLFMPRKFDICIVMTPFDQVVTKYISDRLRSKPNEFRCAFVTKNWAPDDAIPMNVLQTFRNSRRVAIILSEYFEEENWKRWSYSSIETRLIVIVKGSTASNEINLSNKMTVRFNDPWFWDKLKFMIEHRRELEIGNESSEGVELQLLNDI